MENDKTEIKFVTREFTKDCITERFFPEGWNSFLELLKYGDSVTLHTWEWLSENCIHEMDTGKENGNLVCPNGYRIFVQEKNLYGKEYKVNNIQHSEFGGLTINCMGKKEISPFEVESCRMLLEEKPNRGKRCDTTIVEELTFNMV